MEAWAWRSSSALASAAAVTSADTDVPSSAAARSYTARCRSLTRRFNTRSFFSMSIHCMDIRDEVNPALQGEPGPRVQIPPLRQTLHTHRWHRGTSFAVMDREPVSLDDGLRELSRLVLRDETLETTLDRIVQVAHRSIPDTVGVSITLRKGRRPYTAAATSAHVQAIDEREYAVDEGPCITAMETGDVQRLPDVNTESRWPKFTAICKDE